MSKNEGGNIFNVSINKTVKYVQYENVKAITTDIIKRKLNTLKC